jgi:hypothetical protein
MSAVEAGREFRAWTVALVDPTGRRVTVTCAVGPLAR